MEALVLLMMIAAPFVMVGVPILIIVLIAVAVSKRNRTTRLSQSSKDK